jgi:hypothetical protein
MMDGTRKRWVTYRTTKGGTYRLLEGPMPRIPDQFAECSFYLYESESAAENGKHTGGTGFLVGVESSVKGYAQIYAVTNQHLIDDGYCVLRLNRKNGRLDTIVTQPENWIGHPLKDDLCVHPVDLEDSFKWWAILTDHFITREIIDAYRIGYGDEVFLVGRLVIHSGRQKNTPVIRYGNISLMADPDEPIVRGKREDEGFLVECRSLGGFSGSPVFVMTSQIYRGEAAQKVSDFERPTTEQSPVTITPVMLDIRQAGPWLLGIDFGHLPLWQRVHECKNGKMVPKDSYAEANTGITGVVPSWKMMEILDSPKLKKDREYEDRQLRKKLAAMDSIVEDATPTPS